MASARCVQCLVGAAAGSQRRSAAVVLAMTAHADSIYFDHNATTAVAEECLAAMDACLRLGPVNPSSKHRLGDRAKGLVGAARSAVAAAFGASPAEIVFTSGGTESNHLAILGSLAQSPRRR